MNKNKNKDSFTITVRKDSIFPFIFLVFCIVLLCYCGVNTYKSFKYQTQTSVSDTPEIKSETYSDNRMNFMINYPKGWNANTVDSDILNAIMDVIEADGNKFSLYGTKLPTEIAPVVFTSADDYSSDYNQFMSISFRGSNVNLADISQLESLLSSELTELVQATDIEETSEVTSNIVDKYIVLNISTKITDELTIYYTQVSTLIGYNLVTLIHGSSDKSNDLTSDMMAMLSNLLVLGDTDSHKIDCTADKIGTDLLVDRTLPEDIQEAIQSAMTKQKSEELVNEAITSIQEEDNHSHEDSSQTNEDSSQTNEDSSQAGE